MPENAVEGGPCAEATATLAEDLDSVPGPGFCWVQTEYGHLANESAHGSSLCSLPLSDFAVQINKNK